jgi:hypothetical protein
MLVRKPIFVDLEGFDPTYFAYYEDVDFGLRLNLLGYDVWYTPGATVLHQHHGTASRIPAYYMKVLTERNALFTLFKNLETENLDAVLPVALLLLNEKALRTSRVDIEAFNPEEALALPPPEDAARAPWQARPSRMTRLIRLWRARGIRGLTRKGTEMLRVAYRSLAGALRRPEPQVIYSATLPADSQVVPNLAMSHLVAAHELARHMDKLVEKRRWLQAHRKRSDREVLALGRVLLEDPTYGNRDYIAFQHWLCRVTGIDSRFEELKL